MSKGPIGIYDSGIGGISIMKEMLRLMPSESMIYFADNANCPYGNKTQAEIIQYSEKITEFFINKSCKMIVVACNTATAAAIKHLRSKHKIPFIGIEPAIKPAAQNSKTNVVGVLATKGTLQGGHFTETSKKWAADKEIIVQIGDGLVEIVEEQKTGTQESLDLLRTYLKPMLNKQADQIVLGCTHYPFLIEDIQSIVDKSVEVINPAPAVAIQAQKVLNKHALPADAKNKPFYRFYSSGSIRTLKQIVAMEIAIDSSVPSFEQIKL